MNWKAHLVLGVLIQVFFILIMYFFYGWYIITPLLFVYMIIIMVVSPLVPDLDHNGSKINKVLMKILLLGLFFVGLYWWFEYILGFSLGVEWFRILIFFLFSIVVLMLNSVFSRHRGFWHSLPMGVYYGFAIGLLFGFSVELGVLAFIGFWSHLLLDGEPLKIK